MILIGVAEVFTRWVCVGEIFSGDSATTQSSTWGTECSPSHPAQYDSGRALMYAGGAAQVDGRGRPSSLEFTRLQGFCVCVVLL